ncbi:hypothetical protein KF728_22460 [Candidatus Obscuribacterales bacterium]|nr:hypothetical protein [Candidatus Obscuribacterales bacterium]
MELENSRDARTEQTSVRDGSAANSLSREAQGLLNDYASISGSSRSSNMQLPDLSIEDGGKTPKQDGGKIPNQDGGMKDNFEPHGSDMSDDDKFGKFDKKDHDKWGEFDKENGEHDGEDKFDKWGEYDKENGEHDGEDKFDKFDKEGDDDHLDKWGKHDKEGDHDDKFDKWDKDPYGKFDKDPYGKFEGMDKKYDKKDEFSTLNNEKAKIELLKKLKQMKQYGY